MIKTNMILNVQSYKIDKLRDIDIQVSCKIENLKTYPSYLKNANPLMYYEGPHI